MPRERNPLVRKSGFLEAEKFYILAFEGTVTEQKYFEDLRHSEYFNDSGKIETIHLKHEDKKGCSPLDVKALLSKAKAEYNYTTRDEFWLIVDRDDWERIHHIDFDKLYEDCQKEKNFNMALSNPCFEMWLIFHFRKLKDIPAGVRKKIMENAPVSLKHHYIDEYLIECMATGRGYNKTPNPKIFLPRIKTAIDNANAAAKPGETYPKGLGSDVYKLVEKLVKKQ